MRLLTDNPIEKLEQDKFELERRLAPIVTSLTDPEFKTPFSIMISGGWGTGKTSAMAWLKEKLTEPNKNLTVTTCWFYPWKYQNQEDVWKGLIAEVILASIDPENADLHKVVKAVKQFGAFLGSGFVRILSSVKIKGKAGIAKVAEAEFEVSPGEAIRGIGEEYAKHITPQNAYYNAFEDTFKKWIEECYSGDNNRLVVFIDDLDRCMPDVALQVLEALKLYLNVKNLVFVVGVDKAVIDRIVHKRYCDHFGTDGNDPHTRDKAGQYLDKMFQVEVDIQPDARAVSGFRKNILSQEDNDWWSTLSESNQNRVAYVFESLSGITPRAVIRTINTAAVRIAGSTGSQGVTEAVHLAMIELVIASSDLDEPFQSSHFELPGGAGELLTINLRHALRYDVGREFFETWRQNVHKRRRESLLAPTYLSANDNLLGAEVPPGRKGVVSRLENETQGAREDPTAGFAELLDPKFGNLRKLLWVSILGAVASIEFEGDQTSGAALVAEPPPDKSPRYRLISLIASMNRISEPDAEAAIGSLTEIDLSGSKSIDVELMSEIGKLTSLQSLILMSTGISDAGLEHLANLTSLQSLYLSYTKISDAGLGHLAKLTSLQTLDLDLTGITDAGLEHVAKLTSLQTLYLSYTKISDAGLGHLAKLTSLQKLNLSDTSITDAGLEHLAKLTSLQGLFLDDTKISDAGLEHLAKLTSLQSLGLSDTISKQALSSLKAKLPDLKVF